MVRSKVQDYPVRMEKRIEATTRDAGERTEITDRFPVLFSLLFPQEIDTCKSKRSSNNAARMIEIGSKRRTEITTESRCCSTSSSSTNISTKCKRKSSSNEKTNEIGSKRRTEITTDSRCCSTSSSHYGTEHRRRRPASTPTAKCRGRRRRTGSSPAHEPAVGVGWAVGVRQTRPRAAVGVVIAVGVCVGGPSAYPGRRRIWAAEDGAQTASAQPEATPTAPTFGRRRRPYFFCFLFNFLKMAPPCFGKMAVTFAYDLR